MSPPTTTTTTTATTTTTTITTIAQEQQQQQQQDSEVSYFSAGLLSMQRATAACEARLSSLRLAIIALLAAKVCVVFVDIAYDRS